MLTRAGRCGKVYSQLNRTDEARRTPDAGGLYVDVTLEKLVTRGPKGQSGRNPSISQAKGQRKQPFPYFGGMFFRKDGVKTVLFFLSLKNKGGRKTYGMAV